MRWAASLAVIAGLTSISSAEGLFQGTQWVKQQILDRVTISGYRQLGYHNHSVTGDRDAFGVLNYGGQGNDSFTDMGRVRITGNNVLGAINFDVALEDSRFRDPQGERFSIDYRKSGFEVNLGDIQARIPNTNRFVRLNRSLKGVSLGYAGSGFQARVLTSEARGQAITVSLSGNNTPGPYYLQSSQILRGSEQVLVDDQPQQFGTDYSIDYDLGAVTFVNRQTGASKVIPVTSSIVVTYEALGFGSQPGRIDAAGVSYDAGQYGRLGVTAMRQVTGGAGRASTRLESFQGFGAPSTPYFLQFEPLQSQPIIVRVNGIVQTQGVDYRFDAQNPAIFYFTRFMPATNVIDVLYTPRPQGTVVGDRESIGFDYRLPIGSGANSGALVLYQAFGRQKDEAAPRSGTARGAELRYQTGPLEFLGSIRDVPIGFVSVENTGFNRNEKAYDMTLGYTLSPGRSLGLTHRNAAITIPTTSGPPGQEVVSNRFSTLEGFMEVAAGESGWPWRLSHVSTQSRTPTGPSTLDTTSLSTNKRLGRLTSNIELSNQFINGPIVGQGQSGNATLQTMSLRSTYDAGQAWNFGLTTGLTNIAGDAGKGLGRDIDFRATYRPNSTLSINLVAQDSNAGSIATLGQFQSGFGLGFGGNGFSSGATSQFSTGASNFSQYAITGNWIVNDRMTMDGYVRRASSSGSVSANANTDAMGVVVYYDFGQWLNVGANIDASRTNFVSSPEESSTITSSVFLSGLIGSRLSYRAGTDLLLTSGSSTFAQNSANFDASILYRLAPRQNLSMNYYFGQTRGYLPQNFLDLSLTYQYQIWSNVALGVTYRIRDVSNRDPAITSGAYRSNGFDIGLTFNFGA